MPRLMIHWESDSSTCRGFTLIELLVVVSILLILVSLSWPALHRTVARTKQVKCLSNLRQLHSAFLSFQMENEGKLPYETTSGLPLDQQWHRRIFPYLGGALTSSWPGAMGAAYLCPSDKSPYNGVISYGFNNYLGDYRSVNIETNAILLADAPNFRLSEVAPGVITLKYNHNGNACAIRLDGSGMQQKNYATPQDDPDLWKPHRNP